MNLPEYNFSEVISIIKNARKKALKLVNKELIALYWQIGEYISKKVQSEEWGKSIVENLAKFIKMKEPEIKGFSSQNLWRMKQLYETYALRENLSLLVREISWTNNLIIFSRCKTIEEMEYYIRLCSSENYSVRELERQINASTFERTMLADKKLSSPMRELPQKVEGIFKDTYVFEFINITEPFTENQLKKSLIKHLKSFLLELGSDFLFIGEEFRIQVGNSDFFIDLLFFHRELQCLIAFELKIDKFKPEYLGKLDFYLEGLDRTVKKPNENPSVGILLCRDKDKEVVEYALNRSLSPTLVADYKTKLIDKKVLQQKLHEWIEEFNSQSTASEDE